MTELSCGSVQTTDNQAMTPVAYVAVIQQDGPTDFIVTFPDVPEAIAQGDSLEEARVNAYDALAVALAGYLKRDRAFPAVITTMDHRPDADSTRWETAVEPKLAARARLATEMQAQGISNVGLAKRMGRDEKAVRLILSGRGASLDKTLEALRAVGVRAALAA